ncbi:hypothetical protein DPMN_176402 [Dreissena polymorpha]|uniref:Uncharacterized protein n=1 Tax=Dreissena polymorpha TaxID=45954 RepID=A0A9D4EB78_DREPO|nr:hypothetical protein DPMN_176402 [Dreissena polymorpha]
MDMLLKKCPCYASVIQMGTDYVRGPNNHQHGPKDSLEKKIRISVAVKEKAKAQPYKSSGDIAKGARNAQ